MLHRPSAREGGGEPRPVRAALYPVHGHCGPVTNVNIMTQLREQWEQCHTRTTCPTSTMATQEGSGASASPPDASSGAIIGAGAGAAGCGPRQLVLKHSERQWKQRGDGAWAVHNVVDDAAVKAEVEAQAGTTSAREGAVAGGTAKVKVHVMSTGRVIECVVGAGDTRPLRCLTSMHYGHGRTCT